MLTAYGWIVLQSSRDAYATVHHPEQLDSLDEATDATDRSLWIAMRAWLMQNGTDLNWHFRDNDNLATGVLLFSVSTNHRTSNMWRLLDWIVEYGPGSYGLVYVHDDEDVPSNKTHSRQGNDHSNEFRVWRILRGNLEEMADPFLSPIVPRINPSSLA